MANDQRGPTHLVRGAIIQGSFKGRNTRPGATPVAPAKPGPPRAHAVQRQPAQPRHVPAAHPQNPVAGPHINQHSAHLQRAAQAKMAQPRAAQRPPAQIPRATAKVPVVQRHSKDEAFQLPAHRSNFGGGSGQPLPAAVREKMESFFGTSFSDVRVHVGTQAASLGALAFTQGSNLYFAQGQYNPNTPHGQQILGHELAHVVQQRAGRVRNPFGSGVAVVNDRSLEAEADRMGLRAAGHKAIVQAKFKNSIHASRPSGVAQPMCILNGLAACWRSMCGPSRQDYQQIQDGGSNSQSTTPVITSQPKSKAVLVDETATEVNIPYGSSVFSTLITGCALVIFCHDNDFDCYHPSGGAYYSNSIIRRHPNSIFYVYMAKEGDSSERVDSYRKYAAEYRRNVGGSPPLTVVGHLKGNTDIWVKVNSDSNIEPVGGSLV